MKLFIFGSTGDLVKRKVIPALLALHEDDLEIVALGRKNFTNESYREFVGVINENITYQKVNFDALEISDRLLSKEEINYFYVALPPKNIKDILLFLGSLRGFGYQIRICVEKPFGGSLKEAEQLKQIVKEQNLEDVIFLSDHYLFKDEILNLQPSDYKKLKLVLLETVGLEGRVGYYDEVAALKDIVQSHFLNIVLKKFPDAREELQNPEIIKFERGQYKDYEKELAKPSEAETSVEIMIKTEKKEFDFETAKKKSKRESYIEIDGKRIDFESQKNAYINLFADFFEDKRTNFPTVEDAIFAWNIIEIIEKKRKPVSIY